MNVDITKPLLTVFELAEVLAYHPESIRRAIRQKRIKAIMLGQDYRIPKAEVDRIIENGIPFVSANEA